MHNECLRVQGQIIAYTPIKFHPIVLRLKYRVMLHTIVSVSG